MGTAAIRAMESTDIPDVVSTWFAAADDLHTRLSVPPVTPEVTEEVNRQRLASRVSYLLTNDPGGAWVADAGGIVGFGQAFIREDYWVLSLLAVHPSTQVAGIGTALLERTLAYGSGLRGSIQASQDSRAARIYTNAGFDLHPSIEAKGVLRPVSMPDQVRIGSVEDLPLVTEIDRRVRGSARTRDIAHLLERDDATLLLCEDRGYAVSYPDRLTPLSALDEEAGVLLMHAGFSRATPGEPFEVAWLTAVHQWAIRTALAAGLSLRARGPVMLRGIDHLPPFYLPSGGLG